MSIKAIHDLTNEFYFCTFTCTNWFNLFQITESYDEVYNWFTIADAKGFRVCGYVIMPNHLHFIIATPFKQASLNKLVSNGKRFLAYEIVKRLEEKNQVQILKQLEAAVTPSDHQRGKLHQVFKTSFDANEIFSEEMLIQKLNYIHHNPVSGKWNLVSDYLLYPHSSAAFYELGRRCSFPMVHYAEILYGKDVTK